LGKSDLGRNFVRNEDESSFEGEKVDKYILRISYILWVTQLWHCSTEYCYYPIMVLCYSRRNLVSLKGRRTPKISTTMRRV
jgi:hypothetical protein